MASRPHDKLTAERLHKLLRYDSQTGIFAVLWRKRHRSADVSAGGKGALARMSFVAIIIVSLITNQSKAAAKWFEDGAESENITTSHHALISNEPLIEQTARLPRTSSKHFWAGNLDEQAILALERLFLPYHCPNWLPGTPIGYGINWCGQRGHSLLNPERVAEGNYDGWRASVVHEFAFHAPRAEGESPKAIDAHAGIGEFQKDMRSLKFGQGGIRDTRCLFRSLCRADAGAEREQQQQGPSGPQDNLRPCKDNNPICRPGHGLLSYQILFLALLGFLTALGGSQGLWWAFYDNRYWVGYGTALCGWLLTCFFWGWAVFGRPLAHLI